MVTDVVLMLLKRDLAKLKTELGLYQNETAIWKVEPNISNSAGNLTLHLLGNLHAFVGTHIGHTGYVRQRELEFSQKDIAREILLQQIDETLQMIEKALSGVTEEQLKAEFPVEMQNAKRPTGDVLVLLTVHLAYHLGQINYHRRLLDK